MEETNAESRKQEAVPDDVRERLMIISQSIRTIGMMAKVGISYCIVIPGYGARPDDRLASNVCPEIDERSADSIIAEIGENLCCMLDAYMDQMHKSGLPKDAVTGYVEHIYQAAKDHFLERAAGTGEGAGPMSGDAAE